jgi:hypothetical protein
MVLVVLAVVVDLANLQVLEYRDRVFRVEMVPVMVLPTVWAVGVAELEVPVPQ